MALQETKQAVKVFSQLESDSDLKYHINMYLDTKPDEWDFLGMLEKQHGVTKSNLIELEKTLNYG